MVAIGKLFEVETHIETKKIIKVEIKNKSQSAQVFVKNEQMCRPENIVELHCALTLLDTKIFFGVKRR